MSSSTAGKPYIWLYTDRATIVRVTEREAANGLIEVFADGPAASRGRHVFSSRADAALFRAGLERQLQAGGFAELWQSADRLKRGVYL